MLNAELDYSLLTVGQRKYIHARLNPNPIANHKHYPISKIAQCVQMESFYGCDYRKGIDICFSADLVHCSHVLQCESHPPFFYGLYPDETWVFDQ